LIVTNACLTPERPIWSMLPSALKRYMFQIRNGCWSLPYGSFTPLNIVCQATLAV